MNISFKHRASEQCNCLSVSVSIWRANKIYNENDLQFNHI